MFGVSFDTMESHKKFSEKYKLPFILLADTDRKIARSFGIIDGNRPVAPRVTFIIGKDGRIAHLISKVDPATHSTEVRAILAKLSGEK